VKLNIACHTATSAAGTGLTELRHSIQDRASGLRRNNFDGCGLDTWLGRVDALETLELPDSLTHLDSRNNRLAWMGLQQDDFMSRLVAVRDTLGAHRIGVIVGTSTSSIGRTEEAYRQLDEDDMFLPEFVQPPVHNMHSPGLFLSAATGIKGPSLTLSTACSSSAKVFATAHRWIRLGLIDAALVGGVDSLCLNTLYGFNSLQLVSANPCRPFDRRRDGINLGEAAAFALVTRAERGDEADIRLLGFGESSDAYHMSHPHPEGKGAILAMRQALKSAGLGADEIDYVNLHGTGTQANDGIEALALAAVFDGSGQVGRGGRPFASSTKGWTGHTLGAAGMMEAVITFEAMKLELAPGTLNCEEEDEDLHYPVLRDNQPHRIRTALSNSFGFGGSNATLVFGVADD
jgi:3-oxoacyl-[acyl-carrier-protein] synthase-1